MSDEPRPVDTEHAHPQPLATLQLDEDLLPVYDLAEFAAADVRRVASFSSNFGTWSLPPEVCDVLAVQSGERAALEWIHDTGELVLLGGVPRVGVVSGEVNETMAATAGNVPAFLGGTLFQRDADESGMVREYFKSEVMPEGSRVAVLARLAHGPAVHELLWGWHREQRTDAGWAWLVDRLARLTD